MYLLSRTSRHSRGSSQSHLQKKTKHFRTSQRQDNKRHKLFCRLASLVLLAWTTTIYLFYHHNNDVIAMVTWILKRNETKQIRFRRDKQWFINDNESLMNKNGFRVMDKTRKKLISSIRNWDMNELLVCCMVGSGGARNG